MSSLETSNSHHISFMGLTDNVMSHSEAWHFCQLGRLIERADKTSRIVDVKYFILLPSIWDVDTPFDDIQWGALLHSASGFEMYPAHLWTYFPKRCRRFSAVGS